MNGYLDWKWGLQFFLLNNREGVFQRICILVYVIGYGFFKEVVLGYGFFNEICIVEKCIKILLLFCMQNEIYFLIIIFFYLINNYIDMLGIGVYEL